LGALDQCAQSHPDTGKNKEKEYSGRIHHHLCLFYRIFCFCAYLTMRAKVCPALADCDAFDLCSTHRASLPIPSVDTKMVLKIPAAVDPINAGTVAANSFLQHLADGLA
jgi:hypothetical protein